MQYPYPDLSALFESLGADPPARTPRLLDTTLSAGYSLGDQAHTINHRGSFRVHLTSIPSAGVGNNSTLIICPKVGMWIRRWFQAVTNVNWGVAVGIPGALPVTDAGPPVAFFAPEGSGFNNASGGSVAVVQAPFFLANQGGSLPDLFYQLEQGQAGVILAFGQFLPGAQAYSLMEDVWVGPGTAITAQATATNTSFTSIIELEFPVGGKLLQAP